MTNEAEPFPAPNSRRNIDIADLRFNYGVAEGGLPVFIFWVANNLGPTQVALVLAFVTAVAVIARNRKSGVIRLLSVLGFVIVAASAVAGFVLDSDKAFAAQNIVSDIALAAIALISVLMGRPIMGLIIREMVPALRTVLHETDRTFVVLTLSFVALNLFQAAVRIYMLDEFSANTYIVVSRIFAFPLNLGFIGLAWLLVARRLSRETWPTPTATGEPAS